MAVKNIQKNYPVSKHVPNAKTLAAFEEPLERMTLEEFKRLCSSECDDEELSKVVEERLYKNEKPIKVSLSDL